jgi:hypothetical protein
MKQMARKVRTSRSTVKGKAPRNALEKLKATQLERRHRRGYERRPVRKAEFDVWEREQKWGEE